MSFFHQVYWHIHQYLNSVDPLLLIQWRKTEYGSAKQICTGICMDFLFWMWTHRSFKITFNFFSHSPATCITHLCTHDIPGLSGTTVGKKLFLYKTVKCFTNQKYILVKKNQKTLKSNPSQKYILKFLLPQKILI